MPPTSAPSSMRHGGALLATAAAALLLTALTTTAAWAHASGELPHARLSAADTTVTVVWTAAADDAADVAVAAGVWPEEVALDYLDVAFGGDIGLLPSAPEVAAASEDPALRRYLEDRVRILQDGVPCAGTAQPAADFVADGATLVFDCPDPVTEAVVEISLLHDRDPAYRTFSVDGTQQYAVHTAGQPAHPWDFTLAQQGSDAVPITALLLGAGGIALLGAAVLWRVWAAGTPRRSSSGAGRGRART
ncbi:MAG: hypothetical protein R6V28_04355 [Nitriliruptoraceae bacterium]